MKIIKFLIFIFLVITFTSCLSTPPTNNTSNTKVYIYKNPSTEVIEYESIGLSGNSKLATYSIDRGNALVMLEIGSYTIINDVIIIETKNFQAKGTITNNKIIIDGKEFLRS